MILTSPARWLSGANRLSRLSLPARVMGVLFLFLLLCVIGYFSILYRYTDSVSFWSKFELQFLLPLLVLLIALPVTAYYATRFWLETPPSEFPDLDEAWRLGVAALAKAGVDIRQVPLYFTVGITDAKSADHVMQAANWELLVDGLPSGAQPLRWYASKQAVMLFLLDASATSKTHSLPGSQEPQVAGDLRGTLIGAPPQAASARGIRGTIVATESAPAPAGFQPPMSIKGTMLAGIGESSWQAAAPQPVSTQLDRQERILQTQRLERVCELASAARLPLCPLNGMLSVIDWQVLLTCRNNQLASAVRADYDAIVTAAKLHVPMVLLINGLDSDLGFVELVRRVGEDRAKNNRFGHGFNHLVVPNPSQMVALASHAAGAFEDWIYDLFKHPDCLDRSNNEKLFNLLCKTRNELHPRLAEMLSGMIHEGQAKRSVMLAGCYFGATGKNQTRQAFVRSVIEKLVDLEDDIEWSETALDSEERLQSVIRFVHFTNALLIAFMLFVIGFVFLSK